MSKRLIGSVALTISWLTVPAQAQMDGPFDRHAAWFANLPHDEGDVVIEAVRAQYQSRGDRRGAQTRTAVDLRSQEERDLYRAWAWQDWRKDRGRATDDP
jgi:hypothetical protein